VTRDPFLLMGRGPRPDFTLADLKSVRLATVSEVPTPWLCLQHDLRLAGIDPTGIARIADQTMAGNVLALKADEVDVIQVFEPFPSLLLAEGAAHVWHEAARRGPTSYTTFYARRGLLTTRRDELQRMVRAIHRTETWVAKASGRQIAQTIAGYFGYIAPAILEAACTRYKALGIWGDTPVLPRAGYDRLRDGLVSGGSLSPGATFETAVDNTLAASVMAEQLPPLD
jgi:NitT/TauT family transport system substrate-binding protein